MGSSSELHHKGFTVLNQKNETVFRISF